MPRTERWVAGAENDEVAMQCARRVNVAASDDVGGPGKKIDGQKGKGGSSGGELYVGSRGEQAAFIRSVDGFAIERCHTNAECGMAQRGVGKYNLNFVSELCR